jgi:hypothetical protein
MLVGRSTSKALGTRLLARPFRRYPLAYAVLNDQPGPAGRRLSGSDADNDDVSRCGQSHLHRFWHFPPPVF